MRNPIKSSLTPHLKHTSCLCIILRLNSLILQDMTFWTDSHKFVSQVTTDCHKFVSSHVFAWGKVETWSVFLIIYIQGNYLSWESPREPIGFAFWQLMSRQPSYIFYKCHAMSCYQVLSALLTRHSLISEWNLFLGLFSGYDWHYCLFLVDVWR